MHFVCVLVFMMLGFFFIILNLRAVIGRKPFKRAAAPCYSVNYNDIHFVYSENNMLKQIARLSHWSSLTTTNDPRERDVEAPRQMIIEWDAVFFALVSWGGGQYVQNKMQKCFRNISFFRHYAFINAHSETQ